MHVYLCMCRFLRQYQYLCLPDLPGLSSYSNQELSFHVYTHVHNRQEATNAALATHLLQPVCAVLKLLKTPLSTPPELEFQLRDVPPPA